MRVKLDLDEALVTEAMALTGAQSTSQVIHLALEELVERRKKRDLAELSGRLRLRQDFDHKRQRSTRRDRP